MKTTLTPLPEELRPFVRKRNRELAVLVLSGEFGRLNAKNYGDIQLSFR
jgi:hypothetical protein